MGDTGQGFVIMMLRRLPTNFYPDVYAFVSGFVLDTYAHRFFDQQTAWR